MEEFEKDWQKILSYFTEQFGEEPSMESILYIIGINELGRGARQEFSKDQKMNLIHIAICKVLSFWGYYEIIGLDEDGWPHWKATDKLPYLKPKEQMLLLRRSIVNYFAENEIVDVTTVT